MAIWVVRRDRVEEKDVISDQVVCDVTNVRMKGEEDDIESDLEG